MWEGHLFSIQDSTGDWLFPVFFSPHFQLKVDMSRSKSSFPLLTAWLWASYFPLLSLWPLIHRTGSVLFTSYCREGDEGKWESSRQELSWARVLAALPGAIPCSHSLVTDERLLGVSDHIWRRRTRTGSPEREVPDHTSMQLPLISVWIFSSLT